MLSNTSRGLPQRSTELTDSNKERAYANRIIPAALACFIAVAVAGELLGQPRPAASELLPATIRAARATFRPLTDAQLSRRRVALSRAVDQLDRYLVTGGPHGNNWKRFLRWNEMRGELQKGSSADPELLDEIQTLYTSGHPGFEMPIYANVGKAFGAYTDGLFQVQDREARSHYEARIDALAEDVEKYLANPRKPTCIAPVWFSVSWQRRDRPLRSSKRCATVCRTRIC